MTKEMYEDLLERNKLQISELNTLTEEQDRHIVELEKENTKLKNRNSELASLERWYGEAKAIIRKYYNYNHICGYSYEAIDKQAEQFLKEVEK